MNEGPPVGRFMAHPVTPSMVPGKRRRETGQSARTRRAVDGQTGSEKGLPIMGKCVGSRDQPAASCYQSLSAALGAMEGLAPDSNTPQIIYIYFVCHGNQVGHLKIFSFSAENRTYCRFDAT